MSGYEDEGTNSTRARLHRAQQYASRVVVVGCSHCSRRIVLDAMLVWVHDSTGRSTCYSSSGERLYAEPGIDSLARYESALRRASESLS